MTEDEAKLRWCPFARVDSTAANRADHIGFQFDRDPCCIGSACMAWRTASVGRVQPGDEYQTFTREGFCGLAGAPQ